MSGDKSSVNQRSVSALVILAPLLLISSLLVFPWGCGSSGGGGVNPTPTPTMGTIQIGFTDSPSKGFQNILLNIVSVRLNPSTNSAVSDGDPNWVTIAAPPGLGAVGELQIDLTPLQNNAKLFNAASVPAQTYNQVEVIIDQNNPGSIVPSCGAAAAVSEGCITYGMRFGAGASLRTTAQFTVSEKGLTPLIIDFDMTSNPLVPPSFPGGAYTVTPIIKAVSNTALMGTVTGAVTGDLKSNSGATIVAELAGTDTVIATADVHSGSASCDGGGNCYTLQLPAAASSPGTAYDLYLTGGLVNFVAISGLPVTQGGSTTKGFTTVAYTTSGKVTGKIVDTFTQTPIQAATVNLLIPSSNNSNASVVVASTATDDLGNYTFTTVPVLADSAPPYTLEVSASGFDPVVSTFSVPKTGSPTCTYASSGCNFSLTSTTISGNVLIDTAPPSDHNVQVHVMAEDTGTGNLENDVMVNIPSGLTSAPFTIRMPHTSPSVSAFDLIASASDLYQGVPDPFTGHSIAVLSNVTPGGPSVTLGPLKCLGHGSISGTALNPDSGTTVRLLQNDGTNDVQLGETQVGAPGGEFSFCVPPNTYNLQRLDSGSPVASPTGIVVPEPTWFVVPTPAPSSGASPTATATPCPSVCGDSSHCPGVCTNTALDNPL